MHCSVTEHGYDVTEFSNCSTEERGVSRIFNLLYRQTVCFPPTLLLQYVRSENAEFLGDLATVIQTKENAI